MIRNIIVEIKIVQSSIADAKCMIDAHMQSLSYPIDSYIDDLMYDGDIYLVKFDGNTISYYCIVDDILQFFYTVSAYYRYAATIFEHIIAKHNIKKVHVLSQDPQITALIAEWDYNRSRVGFYFTDSKVATSRTNKIPNAIFRTAELSDIDSIHKVCGDFFDPPSAGYDTLEDRIVENTIFILDEEDTVYGVGIVEPLRLVNGYMSIGMFVNPSYRKMGAAKTILLGLKDYSYEQNMQPVAGCWYYNTLSRLSLESAGMIATSTSYHAILDKKENPPMRTGNPPGELVE